MENRPHRRLRRTPAAAWGACGMAVATAAALVLTPSAAFAYYQYEYLESNQGYGHIDGTYVSACDTLADNRGVVTFYSYNGGSGAIADSNGSASGCGHTNAPSTVTSFSVCLRQPGSSSIDYCKNWPS